MKHFWNKNNTICSKWFERDRAHVQLTDNRDHVIISLWDDEVDEFIRDGFKDNYKNWHEALIDYANDRELVSIKS